MTTGVSRAASAAKSSALAALAAFVEATQGDGGENLPPVEELTVEHVTKAARGREGRRGGVDGAPRCGFLGNPRERARLRTASPAGGV